jgi:hypothetical protein
LVAKRPFAQDTIRPEIGKTGFSKLLSI